MENIKFVTEKSARIEVTTILGVPTQTRVVDSLSYFFMIASRSIGSVASTVALFFLKKAMLSSFLKELKG